MLRNLYRMSAYETSATDFFETLRKNEIDLVLDTRLRNESQLCGFTKRKDLEYFITHMLNAKYIHDLKFAPTKELLEAYVKNRISFEEYEREYKVLMKERDIVSYFQLYYQQYSSICLLGTDTKKRKSHSQILYDLLEII